MSTPTPLPLFEDKRMNKFSMPRLELFSMRFSNNKNDNKISNNDSDKNDICNQIFYEIVEDPLKDLFKSVKSPDIFRGRIFIADSYTLHEIYNSETLPSLYTDVPKKKRNRKRKIGRCDLAAGTDEDEIKNSADSEDTDLPGADEKEMQNSSDSEDTDLPGTNEEEMQNSAGSGEIDLPLMGPEVAMEVVGDNFILIVHPESDQADAESQYYDRAKSRYRMGLHPLIPNDDGGLCRVTYYDPFKTFDNLFDFSIDTAYGLLTLDCIVFSDSIAVYLEVKWIKECGDVTDMYVCGRLTVISEEHQDKESVLFHTPPNKAIRAPLGGIKLLRRVVAVPYESEFKVEADLCCSYSIDDDSPFVQIVDGFIIFPNLNDDVDAYESKFMPEDPSNQHPLLIPPHIYEFKKSIPGYGGSLEVKAYVDIK